MTAFEAVRHLTDASRVREWKEPYTCFEPAYARPRSAVSKRRIACAACHRPLGPDLVFEYVSPGGKRLVYCAREDCVAL